MARVFRYITMIMAAALAVVVYSVSAFAMALDPLYWMVATASGVEITSESYAAGVGLPSTFSEEMCDNPTSIDTYPGVTITGNKKTQDNKDYSEVIINKELASSVQLEINQWLGRLTTDEEINLVLPYGTITINNNDFHRLGPNDTTWYYPLDGYINAWDGMSRVGGSFVYKQPYGSLFLWHITMPRTSFDSTTTSRFLYGPVKWQYSATSGNIWLSKPSYPNWTVWQEDTPIPEIKQTGITNGIAGSDIRTEPLTQDEYVKGYVNSDYITKEPGTYQIGEDYEELLDELNNAASHNEIIDTVITDQEPEPSPTPIPTYSPIPIPTAEPIPTAQPIPTITPIPSMTPPPYEYDDTIAGTPYTDLENKLNQIQTNQENVIIESKNNTGFLQNLFIWLQSWLHPSLQAIQENIGEDVIANQNTEHHLDEMPDIFIPPLQENNEQNDVIISNQESQQDSLNDLVDNTEDLEQGLNDIDLHIQQEKGVLESIRDWLRDIYNKLGSLQLSLETILNAIKDAVLSIAQTIELAEAAFVDALIDAIWTPLLPIFDQIKSGLSIWHYVVEWLQCISAPFRFFWQVLVGLGNCFPMPIYAVAAATIVLAVYRRFGR